MTNAVNAAIRLFRRARNNSQKTDEKLAELIAQMTPDEKAYYVERTTGIINEQ